LYVCVEGVLRTNMMGRCQSGWMADFSEYLPLDAVLHDGDAATVHNAFPALWAQVNRNATSPTDHAGDETVYFMRASATKSPVSGSLFWLGDQLVTWDGFDGLRTVVNGLTTAGLSGLSLMHSDLGGE
jgi:alpha-glucosidase